MKFIKDSGPLDAELLIVGEAPGRLEDLQGRPFIGPAGMKLSEWMSRAGLNRLQARITNTYPFRPEHNDLGAVSYSERAPHLKTLQKLIYSMPNLKLVVPMGAYALGAILPTIPGTITQVRGSVYRLPRRTKTLVMPMIHPAASFRQPKWVKRCMRDWERAATVLTTKIALPRPLLEIRPDLLYLRDLTKEIEGLGLRDTLAMDIETPRKRLRRVIGKLKNGKPKIKNLPGPRYISCLAVSYRHQHAVSIPTTRSYWKDDFEKAWHFLRRICASRVPKAFHFGMFDVWHLRRVGAPIRHWWWDTRDMHHALDAWDEHTLAYCASTDTWYPYWKSMVKEKAGYLPWDLDTYWTYNAIDACVTWELKQTYQRRLIAMPWTEAA